MYCKSNRFLQIVSTDHGTHGTLNHWNFMCAALICSVMSDSIQPRGLEPARLSVHGILQARILEWLAMPSSRGSSQPRNQIRIPYVSFIGKWFFLFFVFFFLPLASHGKHTWNCIAAYFWHDSSLKLIVLSQDNYYTFLVRRGWRLCSFAFSSVQLLSWLFATPWTTARQASLSVTNSRSLLKLMSMESVMPSNYLILFVRFSSCLQSFPASGSFPTLLH